MKWLGVILAWVLVSFAIGILDTVQRENRGVCASDDAFAEGMTTFHVLAIIGTVIIVAVWCFMKGGW